MHDKNAASYMENKEAIAEYHKQYYADNADKIAERNKTYYKTYYLENADKIKAQKRARSADPAVKAARKEYNKSRRAAQATYQRERYRKRKES